MNTYVATFLHSTFALDVANALLNSDLETLLAPSLCQIVPLAVR